MVVLPKLPLATTESRAILPEQYSRRDAVLNLQRVALLTAAFAAGRGDLLAVATGDSIHQPYRSTVCPLLPALQPLAGEAGVLSVTLSGAGPSVLLLLDSPDSILDAEERVRRQARQESTEIDEILTCDIAGAAQSIICDQGLRERLPATFM
jgi:homoserine kinase